MMEKLNEQHIDEMVPLLEQLNPKMDANLMRDRMLDMLPQKGYDCFGMRDNEGKLIAICGVWFTTRVYSGRQLEVDNFVVDENCRGQKIGDKFLQQIYEYAKSKGCLTVELNAYVQNKDAHRFYFTKGYRILGFHFEKAI